MQTQQKPLWGRPQGFHLDFALAKRLKSLFKAGERPVPLGTRRLEFAQTSPRAATRFWTKTASGHHISQPNELWPRAWEIISDKLIVYRLDFLLRRAGGIFCDANPTKSGRPLGFQSFCSRKTVEIPLKAGGRPKPASTALRGRRSLRRTGGAFRHSVWAIRARKPSQAARPKTPRPSHPKIKKNAPHYQPPLPLPTKPCRTAVRNASHTPASPPPSAAPADHRPPPPTPPPSTSPPCP